MKRALFDTNVLLDVLLERQPHVVASAAALDRAAQGEVDGYVAAHAVTTLAYLLQRQLGAQQARVLLSELLTRLSVAAVTETAVKLALSLPMPDFEDAVCYAAAAQAGIDVIVTRDPQGFAGSSIPALHPELFLAS